ncbi:ABC transporter ATP-binding protein [Desulfuromonas sp. AOP6]|uniref:ABC transporter ATP-binding protein n=1 Tax=Desulfuromonas sp. AOP6 TaxID=1566351 RepID=UPI001283C058|nr:ABC transporter ATP-binding protein [Desulfuromonas sp. AOP6]BCA80211.1 ABC transporter ATP-binding protein [Desulfuromonas sp. AOP6]
MALNKTSYPIHISKLKKTYRGKRGRQVEALRDLSLDIVPGEVFGFLGPNGAGKSTTIKILMGLIRPSGGEALLFGAPVNNSEARLRVGFLPENPAFYDFLTGREYLDFVGKSFGMTRDAIKSQGDRVLDLLDLTAAAGRPLRSYSKGMVQRLGIAQTLLHDPDLFILDEPMSGLDPIGRALVKEIILDLKARGKTVFFSTHVTADVERVCDRIGVIVNGIFREQRVVSELLREGIDGYFCRVRGLESAKMQSLKGSDCGDGVCEVFVPRDGFDTFSAELLGHGGAFDLIEPRRRDVEKYFLDLVARSEGES